MNSPILARASDVPRLRSEGYVIGEMQGSGLRAVYPPAQMMETAAERELAKKLEDANAEIASLKAKLNHANKCLARHLDVVEREHAKWREGEPVEEGQESGRPSFQYIMDVVAEHYGLTHTLLRSGSRSANIVKPRHVLCWLACGLTGHSSVVIGRLLGGRDHSTIRHSRRRVDALRGKDSALLAETNHLRSKILVAFYGQDGAA